MKKTTYKLPEACQHCGNTDRTQWLGDWSHLICRVCRQTTPYLVSKVEEIDPPIAPTSKPNP